MVDPNVNPGDAAPVRTGRGRSSPIVERNMRALAAVAEDQRKTKSVQDRFAIAVSRFVGQMNFVYIHVVLFGVWMAANKSLIPGVHHFDPDLSWLNTLATLEAIFLATFVLIAQNRMAEIDEIRNHLDVQVSLLTEEETTHILRLVAKMGEKMGIDESADPAIKELVRKVEAQELIDQIGAEIEGADTSGSL
ncbi:MAG: DUF1003 domain-containing protein [Gemmatimonadaceae bacterium]